MAVDIKRTFDYSIKLIPEAIEWAEKQNVERLGRFLLESANVPLYIFGSGGSSSANDYAALLYETNEGMAKALTPLSMTSISDKALKNAKILITASSGRGEDEAYTVPRAAALNPQGICGLTRTNNGKNILVNTLKGITTNWFQYHWSRQKDSFIATNSTFARFALFYKAFTQDNDILDKLNIDLAPEHCYTYAPRVKGEIPSLDKIKNFIVLYSGWGRPVAIDFESKMVESGIASVQMCDYRNFCHGRFIFLSKHLEESALLLLITPKEREYVDSLILKGKTHQKDEELFPLQTPIIKIETDMDSPLAPIDLLIKMNVCFNEIAKAFGDEPCNPKNPSGIHKKVPRSLKMDDAIKQTLESGLHCSSTGTLKGVSRKKAINYDPKKSIEKLAKDNGVSEATIRGYVKEHRIDRHTDEKMLMYNKIWLRYIKDSDQSIASIAKKLKMSENTVKQYLSKNYPQFKSVEGKVTTVSENDALVKLRENLDAAPKRFERVKKMQVRHPEYDLDTILKKLPLSKKDDNVYQVECFMQMDDFDTDIKKGYCKYKNGKIVYIVNR